MVAWEAAWGFLAGGCRPFGKRPGCEDLAADPVMGDDDMWIILPYWQTKYERRYRRSDDG